MSKHIRQKFQNGTFVWNTDWGRSKWMVVVGKPDVNGRIVTINGFGEYSIFYQADLEEADE